MLAAGFKRGAAENFRPALPDEAAAGPQRAASARAVAVERLIL